MNTRYAPLPICPTVITTGSQAHTQPTLYFFSSPPPPLRFFSLESLLRIFTRCTTTGLYSQSRRPELLNHRANLMRREKLPPRLSLSSLFPPSSSFTFLFFYLSFFSFEPLASNNDAGFCEPYRSIMCTGILSRSKRKSVHFTLSVRCQ